MTCQAVPLQAQSMLSNHLDHDPPSRPDATPVLSHRPPPPTPGPITSHHRGPGPPPLPNANATQVLTLGGATPPTLSYAIEVHCQQSAPGQGGVAAYCFPRNSAGSEISRLSK
ncbi:unnamed protein product [Pleuronectes platessa]|uniref:Uncharacterized protein n=1 Tax=Pleuronectes platessa TaxID=8262 RepID=A0A9N7TSK4_PLEPL|nr:unnamed protein product [Pleuronectes platessa]